MPKTAYTFEATILFDRMHPMFMGKDAHVSRTIRIGGDYSLADLHRALFKAFNRRDEHMYEFQIGGKSPMDRDAVSFQPHFPDDEPCFRLPTDPPAPENADLALIGTLQLRIDDRFYYWFDFGDDWWHEVRVIDIAAVAAKDVKPTVLARVGESPPQYPKFEE